MTWLKVDDTWCERPDILRLSGDAFRLHVAGMAYSMRHATDGVVEEHILWRLAPRALELVGELQAGKLWERTADGWRIRDPLMQQQPTREEIEAQRAVDAARMAARRAPDGARRRSAEEELAAARERLSAARAERPEVRSFGRTHGERSADVHVPRPVPTRPGEATPLSGSGVDAAPAFAERSAEQTTNTEMRPGTWVAVEGGLARVGANGHVEPAGSRR